MYFGLLYAFCVIANLRPFGGFISLWLLARIHRSSNTDVGRFKTALFLLAMLLSKEPHRRHNPPAPEEIWSSHMFLGAHNALANEHRDTASESSRNVDHVRKKARHAGPSLNTPPDAGVSMDVDSDTGTIAPDPRPLSHDDTPVSPHPSNIPQLVPPSPTMDSFGESRETDFDDSGLARFTALAADDDEETQSGAGARSSFSSHPVSDGDNLDDDPDDLTPDPGSLGDQEDAADVPPEPNPDPAHRDWHGSPEGFFIATRTHTRRKPVPA
ncbi:hypothetical protein BXZ70DRAFT_910056 [Cristinia sonorae]|uniref:Uncharacterized protein n=1 Tax=Cristinia sonorae TaxID=1940300 RepID=A0A8K0XLE1_9AGAR|nr:hypothetical protein BXZ70DRAFT_910056 [Cristinia sonorae]